MKKIYVLFSILFFAFYVNAQVNYSTNFDVLDANPGEGQWDATGFGGTSTNACAGSSMKDNCYGTGGEQIVEMICETSLGTSLGGYMNVSFDYKMLEYGTATEAPSADFKEIKVYSGAASTGPWTLQYTLSSHTSSSFCATKTFAYIHPAGAVYLQFTFEHSNVSSPDVDIYFDNVSVVEGCFAPAATFTRTCANGTDLDFTVDVNVTGLGAATTVDITDGTNTLFSGVGLGTYTTPTFTGPTTIYVLDHADHTCSVSKMISSCNICSQASVPSNECAGAPVIDLSQSFAGSTTCSYTASSDASVCGFSIDNDSWIKFQAADTDVEIDFQVGECSNGDGVQLAVLSGTCGSQTLIDGSCVNPTPTPNSGTTQNWSFSGLTIGNFYYIRIDGYAGDQCDYWFTPISGVVIVPPNDLCANAIALNCNGHDTQSNIQATATAAPTACVGTSGKGVWYTFTGDGSDMTLSTDKTGTNFDTQINVYTGTCDAFTCVGGDDDSGTGTTSLYTFTTVNATNYTVYVDGDGTAEGQFELSLTCAVAPSTYTVSGTLKYDNTAQNALASQTVKLMDGATEVAAATTDASGNYSFASISNGSYTVTPQVSLDWKGVTAMDATHYIKHINSVTTLTGLRLTSGDVNASTSLTTADITPILQRIITQISSFTSGNWAYSSGAVTVAGANQTKNMQAICYGDANASYPFAKNTVRGIDILNDELILVENGETFTIPVKVRTELTDLASVTLEIPYNAEAFEVTDVAMANNNYAMRYYVHDGIIRIAYASLSSVNLFDTADLLYINITVNELTEETDFITSAIGEFGDIHDAVLENVVLSVPQFAPNSPSIISDTQTNMSIYPNPAKDYITLQNFGYGIAEIYDIFGNPVSRKAINGNTAQINVENLANGTYILKIYQDQKIVTRKFSVLR